MNFLLIESLYRIHNFYGEEFKVEFPTGSGNKMCLEDVAMQLSSRLVKMFLPDEKGRRPCHGNNEAFAKDPHWKDLLLFHEYFHGDSGEGLGSSHQTGWTALVAVCLDGKGSRFSHVRFGHCTPGRKRERKVGT